MNKKEEQREQRRIQLLQIALEEFIVKGFYGTSTREIAKIAGISSGLMFHYFESKEHLYETLISIGCSRLTLTFQPEDSPYTIFKNQLEEIFQMLEENALSAKMFVFMGYATYNASKISGIAGQMLKEHDIISQSISLIQKGQSLGEIRSGDPEALSIAFWCAIQGIAEAIALNPNYPMPQPAWIMNILKV